MIPIRKDGPIAAYIQEMGDHIRRYENELCFKMKKIKKLMKKVSLKRPCNPIQEISCVPSTPNTMANCIGALVRRRDGDTSVVMIVDTDFYNLNK